MPKGKSSRYMFISDGDIFLSANLKDLSHILVSSFLLGPFSLLSLNLLLDHPLDLIRQSKNVTSVTIDEEWSTVVASVGSLPSSNGP